MTLVDTHPSSDFTLYFLAFDVHDNVTDTERKSTRLQREGMSISRSSPPPRLITFFSGILELTHNHGTEDLAETPYHNGNTDPRGFGHIAVTVDDVEAACERFEKLGVQFKKWLTDGRMKNIAFALDPDGCVSLFFVCVAMLIFHCRYWVEIVPQSLAEHPNKPE